MMSFSPKVKDKKLLMLMRRKSIQKKICKDDFRNINKVWIIQINFQDYVQSIVECVEGIVYSNVAVTYRKIALYFEIKLNK